MLLKDKVVLVTGGSAGIGRAIAIEAARQGARVAINHFDSDDSAADQTIAEIKALGRDAIALKADVALPESAPAFVEAAVKAFGQVDVIVLNAGVCPFHAFLDMPHEVFERTMAVNLHGAYYMAQAAANQMVRQGKGGAIIGVSSISAYVGGEYQTHYTTTKAGILSLMNSLAVALGKYGIRCNAVLPAPMKRCNPSAASASARSNSDWRPFAEYIHARSAGGETQNAGLSATTPANRPGLSSAALSAA